MLTRLTISNYLLISQLSVDFTAGLNSVTGETGAGKSIILGALGLIMGNRADPSVLKNKDEKCYVEGLFDIGNYDLAPFFTANELDYEVSTILRREITPAGKSRAFINDTPVNLKVMQDLALKLIDIHSQHQNLELGNQRFQLNLVDSVASNETLLSSYQKLYAESQKTNMQLAEVVHRAEKARADLDYFQFQFDQLNEARLVGNEQELLEMELKNLTHAEEIKNSFTRIIELIDNDTFSAIRNIRESQKIAASMSVYFQGANPLSERLNSVFQELKDIKDESVSNAEKTEHDPERINQVTERLNLIYALQQKHHAKTVDELIGVREDFNSKITSATGYEVQVDALRKKLRALHEEMGTEALKLTESRKKVFGVIEKSVVDVLKQLGIPKAEFRVLHHQNENFTQTGRDNISFTFSSNPDILPEEISRIASGGEMSRLMLAVKNLIRNSRSMPTVIFDEIDAGISGEVAIKMGVILKTFSENTQIINITHLPQIAARGDSHYLVYKFENEGKTTTSIRRLTDNERIEEIAKMVGGEKITEATLRTANEMMS